MTQAPILLDRSGAVATITINRPSRLNAMDSVAHLALSDALDDLAADDGVRVVILTGAGDRAFSAGRDLKELAGGPDAEDEAVIAARWRGVVRLTDRLEYPKPLIAKVRGIAFGGGFELALACDVIVASADARFALPEARRGLIPSAGGVHRLPRQMPARTAMGLMLSGRSIDAARAYALGLVNEVAAPEALDDVAAAWAADIVASAPLSVAAIRQCAARGLGLPLPDALAAEYPAEKRRAASHDSIEGPRAFAEKRMPRWTGS